MKKLWKIKRDSEAVSPVIATILMVAITVVLAAVLLVLVLNIGDDAVPTSATLSFEPKVTGDGGNLTVGFISQSIKISEVTVTIDGSAADDVNWLGGDGTTAPTDIVSGSIAEIDDTVANGQIIRLVQKSNGAVIGQVTVSGVPTA